VFTVVSSTGCPGVSSIHLYFRPPVAWSGEIIQSMGDRYWLLVSTMGIYLRILWLRRALQAYLGCHCVFFFIVGGSCPIGALLELANLVAWAMVPIVILLRDAVVRCIFICAIPIQQESQRYYSPIRSQNYKTLSCSGNHPLLIRSSATRLLRVQTELRRERWISDCSGATLSFVVAIALPDYLPPDCCHSTSIVKLKTSYQLTILDNILDNTR